MEIQLSEEKIQEMVEAEIRKCVDRKIQYVMDNGCANWFTQQNIKMITERVVSDRINPKVIEDIIKGIDKEELVKKFSKDLSEEIVRYFFD